MIIASFLFIIQLNNISSSYDFISSKSDSMKPIFSKGDIIKVDINIAIKDIYAAPKDADPPGDIIAFNIGSDDVIIHRAIEKSVDKPYSFKTMGDNNNAQDWWIVDESNIMGKLVEINPPFWTFNFLFWYIALAIGIFFIISGILFVIVK